jgi:ligand-binding sensor domain-containing protein
LSTRFKVYFVLVTFITLLGFAQRMSAAHRLPVDADEPVYAWAAAYYAGLMARGEWDAIPDYTYTSEHPVLAKLIYAAGLRAVGFEGWPDQPPRPVETDLPFNWHDDPAELGVFWIARYVAVLFGTLEVLVLTLVNPLAGFLLAIHTMTAKYTSQIYLEALPAFALTLSITAYDRARRRGEGHTGGWFWLSAVMLGVAAASKYPYAAVGLVVVPFILYQQRRKPWNILFYGLLAVGTFFLLNPILWPDPLGRLRDSLLFHPLYAQSGEVARYDYPWWQPINWMSGAGVWHAGVFWFPFDFFTFLVGLVGLPFLLRQNELYFGWFVTGWLILFTWPTKWPQYTLIVTPVICLSVGAIGRAVAERYDLRLDRETWERIAFYLPDHTFWITPPRWLVIVMIVLVLIYVVGYVGFRVYSIRQMRGWTTYTVRGNGLPSNTVEAVGLGEDGRVWVGTRNGLAIFEEGESLILRAPLDPLPDNWVTALHADAEGRMWVGTDAGIAVVEGEAWTTYTAAEVGLDRLRVRAMDVDPAGRVWLGTRSGVAMWDGTAWRTFSPRDGGLSSEVVLALAADDAGRIWMGTERGLAVLDLTRAEPGWRRYTAASSPLPSNSVRALEPRPAEGMWVGMDGGGLCAVEQEEWTCYRTGNSPLPWNTVAALMVDEEGRVWAATHKPVQVGGAVAVFDGQEWQVFNTRNSGLAGGQVTALLEDEQGRYWFGTPGSGVSLFEPP